MKTTFRAGVLVALIPMLVVLAGCGQERPKTESPKTAPVAENQKHDHSDWWCAEHGVPEHDCAQCSAKVAAEYKKKGDWCKKHDRPESQCFICHRELKEKFAALYRAKYGKEPPPIDEEKEKKQ